MRIWKNTAALCLACTAFLTGPALLAQASPPAIEAAKTMLTDGRYADALGKANEALQLEPNSHEAHYYAGMAHFGLQQMDRAADAARKALSLAPPEAQATIQQLIDMIGSTRAGAVSSAEAEVALAEGRNAKAAELYEALWRSDGSQTEYAMKAADLYATNLQQFARAARLYNAIIAVAPESDEAKRAKAELERFAKQMGEARSDLVRAAYRQQWPAAKSSLQAAIDVEPSNVRLKWILLARAVAANDFSFARSAVAEIARKGAMNVDFLSRLPNMNAAMANAEFSQFVADAVGAESAQKVAALSTQLAAAGYRADSIKNALPPLIQNNAIYFFVAGGCDSTINCQSDAIYNVSAVNITDDCNISLALGSPLRNAFTDRLTSRPFQFDNISIIRQWKYHNFRGNRFNLIELRFPGLDPSHTQGFLVESAMAESLAMAIDARVNSCGGLIK